ncbi:hypothetical protein SLAVM298S_01827 [Streptomyces lavendulae subsp. lavendulae]
MTAGSQPDRLRKPKRQSDKDASHRDVAAVGERSVAAGGGIKVAITGDHVVYHAAPAPVDGPGPLHGYAVVAVTLLAVGGVQLLRSSAGLAAATALLLSAACVLLAGVYLGALSVRRWWRLRRRGLPAWRLDEAVELLGREVEERYGREERLARTHDPIPLPVRWARADPQLLTQDWSDGDQSGADVPSLEGEFGAIADFFRRLPSGRLVLLGAPGAGKSVLALHLARELLAMRRPASSDPVPVVLPLASWDPGRQGLWGWAASRLAQQHPGLSASGGERRALLLALLRDGRLLPVLDGFDELPESARSGALRELRASLGRSASLVLTSRTGAYAAETERHGTGLPGAAVVELQPLAVEAVAAYLTRDGRRTRTGGTVANVWDPVLARIRDPGRDAAALRLRTVLATPLMAGLARTAYTGPAADPQELLDWERFATHEALERHLIDQFITTVYAESLDDRTATGGPSAEEARRWAGFLAHSMRSRQTQDLVLWELDEALPRAVRRTGTAAALALAVVTVRLCGIGLPPWRKAADAPAWTILLAAAVGALVLDGWGGRQRDAGPARHLHRPSGADLRQGARQLRGSLWQLLLPAVSFGAVAALTRGVDAGPALPIMALSVLLAWLVIQLKHALAFVSGPADPSAAGGPPTLLRDDRRAALVTGFLEIVRGERAVPQIGLVLLAPAFLLGVWAYNGGRGTVGAGAWAGTVGAVLAALAVHGVAVSAWGRFAWARIWLAATGRLPWRLMAFLRDAHRRGMLRQSSGVYRFRHIELRNRLADVHGTPATGAAAPDGPVRRRAAAMARRTVVWATSLALLGALTATAGAYGPGGPHDALPPACELLPAQQLAPLMQEPSIGQAGHDQCGIHPGPADSATIFLDTQIMQPAPGKSAVAQAAAYLRGWAGGEAQWLDGPGDKARLVTRADVPNWAKVTVRSGNVLITVDLVHLKPHSAPAPVSVLVQQLARTALRNAALPGPTGDRLDRGRLHPLARFSTSTL